ncbi:MAG: prepilin-type N-terminal cleavage/methylation domain-containing protein [Tepidisphaeraceae bacterium]
MKHLSRANRRAFTLVELLVVIGIIALLISILLPALTTSRATAMSVKCLSNLKQIGTGLVLYNTQNRGYNVPSYNMRYNTTASPAATEPPLDGWACILDRDKVVTAGASTEMSVFNCPSAVPDSNVKEGSVLWPTRSPGAAGKETTDPTNGFNKILRVGYWINAENPIGRAANTWPAQRMYYTCSPGYGPLVDGSVMGLQKMSNIRHPTQLIVLADGIYAGRQGDVRATDAKCRIGYRHRNGKKLVANIAFADGHAGPIFNDNFPRSYDTGADNADAKTLTIPRQENLTGNPTVYANPEAALR